MIWDSRFIQRRRDNDGGRIGSAGGDYPSVSPSDASGWGSPHTEAKVKADTYSPSLNTYVLLIGVVFSLFILGAYIADNLFYTQAEMQFTDEIQLSNFLGIFWGIVGLMSLVMQLFVSGWMLRRFGIRSILLFTPVTLGISGLLMVIAELLRAETIVLFGVALIANTCRLVLDATDAAAVNLLYQPLSPHQRTQAQTMITGVVYPVSIGAVGVLLLVLVNGFGLNTVQLAGVLVMVTITWIAAVVLLGKAYLRRLQQALVGSVPQRIIDRRLRTQEMRAVYADVQAEVAHASYLLASLHITDDAALQFAAPLIPAFRQSRERILCGLSGVYDVAVIAEMRQLLYRTIPDEVMTRQQRAIMLEMLDMTLPRSLKPQMIALFGHVPENRDTSA